MPMVTACICEHFPLPSKPYTKLDLSVCTALGALLYIGGGTYPVAASHSNFCKIQLRVITHNFDCIKLQICKSNVKYLNIFFARLLGKRFRFNARSWQPEMTLENIDASDKRAQAPIDLPGL